MKGDVNYIIQTKKIGGLDIDEFITSLEAIFATIDTQVELTDKDAKAIFEAEVVAHKEKLYTCLSKVEKQKKNHVDIVSSVEEAKVVAMAKVENLVHRMETLRKELAEVEAEFNEFKRNEAHLDR